MDAVTPEPQVVVTGLERSMPRVANILESVSGDFSVPSVLVNSV